MLRCDPSWVSQLQDMISEAFLLDMVIAVTPVAELLLTTSDTATKSSRKVWECLYIVYFVILLLYLGSTWMEGFVAGISLHKFFFSFCFHAAAAVH